MGRLYLSWVGRMRPRLHQLWTAAPPSTPRGFYPPARGWRRGGWSSSGASGAVGARPPPPTLPSRFDAVVMDEGPAVALGPSAGSGGTQSWGRSRCGGVTGATEGGGRVPKYHRATNTAAVTVTPPLGSAPQQQRVLGSGAGAERGGGAPPLRAPPIHHLSSCIPCGAGSAPSVSCCQPRAGIEREMRRCERRCDSGGWGLARLSHGVTAPPSRFFCFPLVFSKACPR